jgi:hypothetical protein
MATTCLPAVRRAQSGIVTAGQPIATGAPIEPLKREDREDLIPEAVAGYADEALSELSAAKAA